MTTTRESHAEYIRFLVIAFGSLRELHYQVTLSKRLDYLDEQIFSTCEKRLTEAEKVLGALIRSLRMKKY